MAAARLPGHAVVGYADLVEDPERELRRICSEVGLPFDPRMIAGRADAADRVIAEAERAGHKGAYTREVRMAGGKFERVFDPNQQRLVEAVVDAVPVDRLPLRPRVDPRSPCGAAS